MDKRLSRTTNIHYPLKVTHSRNQVGFVQEKGHAPIALVKQGRALAYLQATAGP